MYSKSRDLIQKRDVYDWRAEEKADPAIWLKSHFHHFFGRKKDPQQCTYSSVYLIVLEVLKEFNIRKAFKR